MCFCSELGKGLGVKLPAIHLYPGDWLKDNISGCSLEAQGLWLRMMFLMHDSERYGYLSINGRPIPHDVIARRCGTTVEAFAALLSELDSMAIPSRTSEGIIYSRRMVRDAKLRTARASAGSTGGQAKRKQNASKPSSKTQANAEDEDEDEDEKQLVVQCETIWKLYPRKAAKPAAMKKIKAALGKVAYETLLAAVKKYAKDCEGKDVQYIPHPATWFNQERWNDAGSDGALVPQRDTSDLTEAEREALWSDDDQADALEVPA